MGAPGGGPRRAKKSVQESSGTLPLKPKMGSVSNPRTPQSSKNNRKNVPPVRRGKKVTNMGKGVNKPENGIEESVWGRGELHSMNNEQGENGKKEQNGLYRGEHKGKVQ